MSRVSGVARRVVARSGRRVRRGQLASDERAGVHSRRLVRAEFFRWFRRVWKGVAVVVGTSGVVTLAGFMFVWRPAVGYLVGALWASVCWMVYVLFVQTAGVASRTSGILAEEWTASELRSLRRQGWEIVNHVMLEASDIDHVALGPGGFVAVETKFRSDWNLATVDLDRIATQATRGARSLRSRLDPRGRDTIAVVALWGPNVATMHPEPFEHRGVLFCRGAHLAEQMRAMPHVVDSEQIAAAFDTLDDYIRKRDVGERTEHGLAPRSLQREVNSWTLVFGSLLLTLVALLSTLGRAPHGLWTITAAIVVGSVALVVRRRLVDQISARRMTTAVIAAATVVGAPVAVAVVLNALTT